MAMLVKKRSFVPRWLWLLCERYRCGRNKVGEKFRGMYPWWWKVIAAMKEI